MKKWLKQMRQFRLDASGPEAVLGELETAVMEVCWRLDDAGLKDIHEALSRERSLAYTTVQTTVDRLYKKGLLRRIGRGRNFSYCPAVSREEFLSGIAGRILDALFGNFETPTLAALMGSRGEGDRERLEALLRTAQQKRAQEG